MRVTAELLRAKDACEDQVNMFESLFPEGVEITQELCVKHAGDFDWNWAAKNFLPRRMWPGHAAKHVALWADYMEARAPLWADYAAERTSLAAFAADLATLLADYKAKSASLFGSLASQVP